MERRFLVPHQETDHSDSRNCCCWRAQVWVSRSEIQSLWKGTRGLSTRRAGGVDPEGNRGCSMWEGRGSPGFPRGIQQPLLGGT